MNVRISPPARKVLLSAVAPSNRLTLGNYIGALRNWVGMQRDYDCIFLVADLHAITVRREPKEVREQTLRVAATYVASGIDPRSATVLIQSHVPQHAELTWVLNCHAYMGELSRMTQFKEKSLKQGQNVSAGLFTYPLLMAADILLYRADLVPIGADQKQHLELTRDIAARMNNLYGQDLFRVPEPVIPPIGARIMSLQNPAAKMSKSDPDPDGAVYLTDTDDQIARKIKRAVTDSGAEVTFEDSKPGVRNLIVIHAALTGKAAADIAASYAGKRYGVLKTDTAELVQQAISPIRNKADELMKDRAELEAILRRGAERSRLRAKTTMETVYERIGLAPRSA